MGHRDAPGWHSAVQKPYTTALKADTDYNVFLSLNGSTATLVVDSRVTLTYAFAPRIDADGFTYFLRDGMVGLGANNAKGQIDNVVVQRLAPELTFSNVEDLSDGAANLFTGDRTGAWTVASGAYTGTPSATTAVSFMDLSPAAGLPANTLSLNPASILQLETKVKAQSLGGIVFDGYGTGEYKFAAVKANTNEVVIGHVVKGNLVIDAKVSRTIGVNTAHVLGVSVKGTTVSAHPRRPVGARLHLQRRGGGRPDRPRSLRRGCHLRQRHGQDRRSGLCRSRSPQRRRRTRPRPGEGRH